MAQQLPSALGFFLVICSFQKWTETENALSTQRVFPEATDGKTLWDTD